ncbi:MAG: amino acid permease [Leptospirales bacterium]|nr:amino acid permease [Leptospirales bacterium]
MKRVKPIEHLLADTQRLGKHLGPFSLVGLGVGAIIGAGIFILTGSAAAGENLKYASILHAPVIDIILKGPDILSTGRLPAGPGVTLSFLITGLICTLAALNYAELASMIPVAGSTYTYAYATLGELIAWIIGWDLILEYAVSNMAVAVGFSAYMNDVLDSVFGLRIPPELARPIFENGGATGAWFNLPSFLIVMLLTVLLVRGVKQSASTNNVMVLIKLAAILIFVFGSARYIKFENYHPFFPGGFSGVMAASAIVFFTYFGFDSVSTAAEEAKNPGRDMPIGIIVSLCVCAILYMAVAITLTGIADYKTLANSAPVAGALKALGLDSIRSLVGVGAIIGIISCLLVFQYGQARIWFAMSRDGLLPPAFGAVHETYKTPHISTWIAGLVVGIPAGIWDIGTFADLANIGTLSAFVIVSAGVLILRKTDPGRPRPFRVPFVPFLPVLSILSCLMLMISLPLETWVRFFIWLAIGLLIYYGYGRRKSKLAAGT